ncbi:MAG TPA: 4-hydroxythreonine-4-phosphate dehydrogenase PdxA [Verrucomicrobiae bacterium]|jgi:4-hydroxythreonine-4-phosphate dehydrogenase|nr:4-hydroxythreonine-4-phosphate dehydrogenase PdxA [Verrucomicrobiae bacterium]
MMRIGITLGDVTGVGPEVALKAVAAESQIDDTQYVFIGDETLIRRLNQKLPSPLPLAALPTLNQPGQPQSTGRFFITNPLKNKLPAKLPPGSTVAAKAAMAALHEGAGRCLRGELDALVTAPVNKEAIIRAGFKDFVGQTEFLSELAGAKRTAMMLLGHDDQDRWLRVALATIHIAIKAVPKKLTAEKVSLAIELAAKACRDLRLPRARVAVAGLNPHAGEGGEFGDEEIKMISPVVSAMRKKGFDVVGPLSGDTVFYYALRGDFDAVVAMYHDQGLAPLKAVAFDTGVNWTLGLPFIRTSPDHGTAYDIAGQWIANPSSMEAAIRLAKKLASN